MREGDMVEMPKLQAEVCRELGVPEYQLRYALRTGKIDPEPARVGNFRMYGRADVERVRAWYAEHRRRQGG